MHKCPVCGWPELNEESHSIYGSGSHEICRSCGVQFGLHDYNESFDELRQKWISEGMKWRGKSKTSPPSWDPEKQLQALIAERASSDRIGWVTAEKLSKNRRSRTAG